MSGFLTSFTPFFSIIEKSYISHLTNIFQVLVFTIFSAEDLCSQLYLNLLDQMKLQVKSYL
jgi:hypothetical protein